MSFFVVEKRFTVVNAFSAAKGLGDVGIGRSSDNLEFEAVFRQHYRTVAAILMRLVGDPLQAEELTLEVFWRFSRRSDGWLFSRPAEPWLYRTATNLGLDAVRAGARRRKYESAAASHVAHDAAPRGALEDLLQAEARVTVRTVLSSMKPAQAQILLMRAEGSSYRELANALGVQTGSIGTLLNRAEAEFRKRYLKLTGKEENV